MSAIAQMEADTRRQEVVRVNSKRALHGLCKALALGIVQSAADRRRDEGFVPTLKSNAPGKRC
jgi:hypothetical protein